MQAAVDARLGADGPSFGAAREAVQRALEMAARNAPPGSAAAPQAAGAHGDAGYGADTGGHWAADAAGAGADARMGAGAAAAGGGAPMGAGLAGAGAWGDAAGARVGGAGGIPGAGGPPRALQSRAQALAQLRLVADFFRRTEPHSPVAYLADKAAGWGELPLHEWLRAVVKDPAQLAQLDELLGAPVQG